MTAGEAAIFFGLVGTIIAFLYKAIREQTNAEAFRKILNQITLTQKIQASRQHEIFDKLNVHGSRLNNHDEEFEQVRKTLREMRGT